MENKFYLSIVFFILSVSFALTAQSGTEGMGQRITSVNLESGRKENRDIELEYDSEDRLVRFRDVRKSRKSLDWELSYNTAMLPQDYRYTVVSPGRNYSALISMEYENSQLVKSWFNGELESYSYTDKGLPAGNSWDFQSGNAGKVEYTYREGILRHILMRKENSNEPSSITNLDFFYDESGRVMRMEETRFDLKDSLKNINTYSLNYDDSGNLTSLIFKGKTFRESFQFLYNSDGRLITIEHDDGESITIMSFHYGPGYGHDPVSPYFRNYAFLLESVPEEILFPFTLFFIITSY
ncbi:MAG: hypothetical protein PQJ58_16250 [Spirochaetales bacterium]|nr:hypothetical protein [Spirochaetales bacterium]